MNYEPTWLLAFITALLGVMFINAVLWARSIRQQNRTTMRKDKNKVKIIVNECVSVDVELICPADAPSRVTAEIALTLGTFKVGGNINMFQYTTDQRITGVITPKDDKGKPAGYENLVIASSDPALGEVQRLDEEPDNELKFQVISPIASQVDWGTNSNPRPFTITIDFDGKVGTGTTPVHIEINGELVRRDATSAGVELTAATDYNPSGE